MSTDSCIRVTARVEGDIKADRRSRKGAIYWEELKAK